MKNPYTFAIVGGGLTATSALCQIVDRLARLNDAGQNLSRELSILVFEKKEEFGPGLPHSEQIVLPFHITNMRAEDMSVRADQPGDFEAWVKAHAYTHVNTHVDATSLLPSSAASTRQDLCTDMCIDKSAEMCAKTCAWIDGSTCV